MHLCMSQATRENKSTKGRVKEKQKKTLAKKKPPSNTSSESFI